MTRRPRIALTIGDPAGVGAEIALKALSLLANEDRQTDWLLIGDSIALEAGSSITGIALQDIAAQIISRNTLPNEPVRFGELRAAYGLAAIDYVRHATELCLAGEADALVTAPLNKESVTLSGQQFSGHTEYIAELCSATESRMLLVSDKLATVHVTTHVPLEQACHSTPERVLRTIQLGDAALRLMRNRPPRIAVCGLNPHAGEHNLFGRQDSEIIAPAIAQARALGLDATGPWPADTIFLRGLRGEFDLIVAQYHDQGHIPMKLIDFEATVNVSLGIPIIRTSVDHGTAFDIAGKNLADPANMLAAMRLAARMAANKINTGVA
ncbi:MAG: 4-hydroxythreonine-4-phosphate dehydrogenase PdxA [Acidobacteriota bacterium]